MVTNGNMSEKIDAALEKLNIVEKHQDSVTVSTPPYTPVVELPLGVKPAVPRKMPDIFTHLVKDIDKSQRNNIEYLANRVNAGSITIERAWEIFYKRFPDTWLGKHR